KYRCLSAPLNSSDKRTGKNRHHNDKKCQPVTYRQTKGAIVRSDSRRAPCSPLLVSEFSILFHQLLQRVGQLLEGNDLDFRAITEMRKNIENNMLARVRHYADDQADLFVDNRLY